MSQRQLARYVNDLLDARSASVTETGDGPLVLHGVSLQAAIGLRQMVADLGWSCTSVDCSDMEVTLGDLDDYCEPFDVRITKVKPSDELLFISAPGFRGWLEGSPSGKVRYAQATVGFETESFVLLAAEDESRGFTAGGERRSPRMIVKSVGETPLLTADVRPYILVGENYPWSQQAFGIWLEVALPRLMVALSAEVNHVNSQIDFAGPPKVTLEGAHLGAPGTLGTEAFLSLQSAIKWVYEVDREAETRKKLFGIEFARSVKNRSGAYDAFREGCGDALEGAKIAHQFGLAEVSRDALKSMADLRKSVADETAKITDATRQLSLSIAGAMFYGLGLIAARLTSVANPYLLDAMAIVGLGYVSAIIWITHNSLEQQEDLRARWRGKFYEFLRTEDYKTMVTEPLEKSEESLRFAMKCAGVLSLLLFAVVGIYNHAA